jgi:hypothetical protein
MFFTICVPILSQIADYIVLNFVHQLKYFYAIFFFVKFYFSSLMKEHEHNF